MQQNTLNPYMLTASGRRVDLLDPRPSMIELTDIAFALSRICRFTGHTRRFYSVAEHSALGATTMSDDALALEFLLHDAHEAYVGDMNSPLKSLCPDFRRVATRIDGVIRERFGLPPVMSPEVMHVDLRMLATEKRDLMPEDVTPWPCLAGVEPFPIGLALPVFHDFEKAFLYHFHERNK